MSTNMQLREWSDNLAKLQTELDEYEQRASVTPSARHGVKQLLAFQMGTFLALFSNNPRIVADKESPASVLALTYFVAVTSRIADDSTSMRGSRSDLSALIKQLRATAARWISDGVDNAEREHLVSKLGDAATQLKLLTDRANGR